MDYKSTQQTLWKYRTVYKNDCFYHSDELHDEEFNADIHGLMDIDNGCRPKIVYLVE